MRLAYSSDENYAPLATISAVSALRHNPGAEIFLLGHNLSQKAQNLVKSRVEQAGGSFTYLDVSPELERLKAKGCNGYVSYATYARIFIPALIPGAGQILYLDCDTLVAGSLDGIFDTLVAHPFALGQDCTPESYKKAVNIPPDATYFNAGVMPIDLESWRKHRVTERFLAELDHPHGPNPMGDQDIFARVFQGEIAPLHPKYNFAPHFFMFSFDSAKRIIGKCLFSPEEYAEAREKAVIYHFLGHTMGRPWYVESRSPMRKSYLEAAKAAGFENYAMQSRPLEREYRLLDLMWRNLPERLFGRIAALLYRINIYRMYRV